MVNMTNTYTAMIIKNLILPQSMVLNFYHLLGAVVLQPLNRFHSTDLPEAVRDLNCNGSETSIADCQIDQLQRDDCGRLEVAGIVCQGMKK